MPYLYGLSDTKYLEERKRKSDLNSAFPPFKYTIKPSLARHPQYNHDAWPILFRASPDSLVELSINVVDKLPLSPVYEWNDKDIRLWICRFGFPQYMLTFRVNMICGRKLLLLDANALSAMNIKDFDHIKRITYGIRMLFHFQLTKFSSSLSLPDEKPSELYLLWHTQTGVNYDKVRRSDLYRRMQLIQGRSLNRDHWDLLELWLRRERIRKYSDLIGSGPRQSFHTCPEPPMEKTLEYKISAGQMEGTPGCFPPCTCYWEARDTAEPWQLQCLRDFMLARPKPNRCKGHKTICRQHSPLCECNWEPNQYLTGTVLNCLKHRFPDKFAPSFDTRIVTKVRPRIVERWTRFSI